MGDALLVELLGVGRALPVVRGMMNGQLSVGVAVRIWTPGAPLVSELRERAEVVRIDQRGVLIRLKSGQQALVEPGMLAVVPRST